MHYLCKYCCINLPHHVSAYVGILVAIESLKKANPFMETSYYVCSDDNKTILLLYTACVV